MARIHQLPPSVITKIAAGEVIERPSSVVKEMLENSVDAGATRIDIDLEQGGTELIRIVDDGHGIEPEDLPRIFDRFYRVDKARSRRNQPVGAIGSGAGLGLSIVKMLVEQNSGRIWVESPTEGGTAFVVALATA